MLVVSSTQHPTEVQHLVAHALGRHANQVTVQCRRMGGVSAARRARRRSSPVPRAVVAAKTARPVKLRLDRDDDMIVTGKRHEFLDYDVAYAADGRSRRSRS
jgi:xanthine dehydrogenase large subunit